MLSFSYDGAVSVWQNKTPLPSSGSGVRETLVKQSKPGCHAAQQQRVRQQSQTQVAFHAVICTRFRSAGQIISPEQIQTTQAGFVPRQSAPRNRASPDE